MFSKNCIKEKPPWAGTYFSRVQRDLKQVVLETNIFPQRILPNVWKTERNKRESYFPLVSDTFFQFSRRKISQRHEEIKKCLYTFIQKKKEENFRKPIFVFYLSGGSICTIVLFFNLRNKAFQFSLPSIYSLVPEAWFWLSWDVNVFPDKKSHLLQLYVMFA